ncbi:Protein phosphatase inhibitor 2 [Galemys pyrenaicus]|uniref:Protein phosphatase inhibitor 2 n=1 Tax=Galemys pyrenaicus TaxID=202257 RepID=A0A8J5ZWM4_GALPY|nr:Protein phosphatase inhibitor 2 [Galemys pyrenaicus]
MAVNKVVAVEISLDSFLKYLDQWQGLDWRVNNMNTGMGDDARYPAGLVLLRLPGLWKPCPTLPAYSFTLERRGRLPQVEIPSSPTMATSSTSHLPIKGILKNKGGSVASSVAGPAQQTSGAIPERQRKKSQKWDESSILATYRPAYGDHDLMKISEPSLPYPGMQDDSEDGVSDLETKEVMNRDISAKKLAATDTSEPAYQTKGLEHRAAHTTSQAILRQEKQREFEMKRKLHYNEGLNIKLARQLISTDFQNEEEKDENEDNLHIESEDTTEESDSSYK